jgi:Tfp pilus assembly protein PilE
MLSVVDTVRHASYHDFVRTITSERVSQVMKNTDQSKENFYRQATHVGITSVQDFARCKKKLATCICKKDFRTCRIF